MMAVCCLYAARNVPSSVLPRTAQVFYIMVHYWDAAERV